MQLDEYQVAIQEFAIYPESSTGSTTELSYLALGLGGESGEVLEKTKKLIRDGKFVKEDVAKELGDVLWYLARYTNAIGYTLNEVAEMNINKLASRKERNVLAGSGDNR